MTSKIMLLVWGTSVRGLTRGLATLPHGKQEHLVFEDTVERPR